MTLTLRQSSQDDQSSDVTLGMRISNMVVAQTQQTLLQQRQTRPTGLTGTDLVEARRKSGIGAVINLIYVSKTEIRGTLWSLHFVIDLLAGLFNVSGNNRLFPQLHT
jgi:hypothetical protein